MLIQVNENWRIRTDLYNWIVERCGGNTNNKRGRNLQKAGQKKTWKAVAYAGTPEQAMKTLFENAVRLIESDVLAEIIKHVQKLHEEVTAACVVFRECAKDLKNEDYIVTWQKADSSGPVGSIQRSKRESPKVQQALSSATAISECGDSNHETGCRKT